MRSDRQPSLYSLILADLARLHPRQPLIVGFVEHFILSASFSTVVMHRITAWSFTRGVVLRVFAYLLSRLNIACSACHLHPKSRMGGGLSLPHPTAVVIGEGVTAGENVTIYQSVTLGIGSDGGYPSIGSGVTIYPGAVVVGAITIGDGAIIGANSFVASSVEPGAVVAGVPGRQISARQDA